MVGTPGFWPGFLALDRRPVEGTRVVWRGGGGGEIQFYN